MLNGETGKTSGFMRVTADLTNSFTCFYTLTHDHFQQIRNLIMVDPVKAKAAAEEIRDNAEKLIEILDKKINKNQYFKLEGE